ncbi:MAG TPA: M56 family metallopeptidase [Clostridiales bacterium]|nr:M56 family metallopeptidase [Clostridiales bacterium]HOL91360.1 M56 family metallopeptidase [Clostridiales bacterium]HPP35140.1 M56 family metallopeptidase [Clostridiales bacterium]
MIADIFYIMLFISCVSAISWLMLLFVRQVGNIRLPHAFYVILMLLLVIPVKYPGLKLIDPENDFMPGVGIAARIWIAGMIAYAVFMILKMLILKLSVRKFTRCTDPDILALLDVCAKQAGLKKSPVVYYGTLNEPACVATCIRPAVVLSQKVTARLSEEELFMVLLHECIHVKRFHLPLKRLFTLLCCIHWMNPVIWIAKRAFSLSCEMDCDAHVIKRLPSGSEAGYARMLMRLMEMSRRKPLALRDSAGILAYREMKQRFEKLFLPAAGVRRISAVIACVLMLIVTVWCSLSISKGTFYPYPAYQNSSMEWSER